MADDDHFRRAQFVHRHQNASHRASERVRHLRAGVLDDLHIALTEIHGVREKLDQTRIHAGEDHQFFVRKSISEIPLVIAGGDETGVVLEDFAEQ